MTDLPPIPGHGVPVEVVPGVFWLRLPLPFALNAVNVWLLKGEDGWVTVDTGIGDDASTALWEKVLEGPFGDQPPDRIVCTHYHPDHMGLAGWLSRRFHRPVTVSRAEQVMATRTWSHDRVEENTAGLYTHALRCGYPPEQARNVAAGARSWGPLVQPLPEAWSCVTDGDRLEMGGRTWLVMTFGGHSPEHLCLWCEADRILISGDQILPRISPAVGAWPRNPEADPLKDFLASLSRLGALPGDTLVLPAHDRPFLTLRERCRELAAHHQNRLVETLRLCCAPSTVLEVSKGLFRRRLDGQQQSFAIAETLAHLNHLVARGEVARTSGASGEWLFQAASLPPV